MRRDPELLAFFAGKPDELLLCEALLDRLEGTVGEYRIEVKRTQVSLFCRRMFACVSFLRARSRAELPAHWITVSFGLPVPCDSRRVDRCVEAARNRWTHHLIVGSPEEPGKRRLIRRRRCRCLFRHLLLADSLTYR